MTVSTHTPGPDAPGDDVVGVLATLGLIGARYVSFDPPEMPPPRPEQSLSIAREDPGPPVASVPSIVSVASVEAASSSELLEIAEPYPDVAGRAPGAHLPDLIGVLPLDKNLSSSERSAELIQSRTSVLEPAPTHALLGVAPEPPNHPPPTVRINPVTVSPQRNISMTEVFHTIGFARRPISLRDVFVGAAGAR